MITITPIIAEQTYCLRQSILRPKQPIEACCYPGDNSSDTRHFGAFLQEQLVGICSVYLATNPSLTKVDNAQLRAMATTESARGKGLGQQLLTAAEVYAQSQQSNLWANARCSALGFYQQAGFNLIGGEFHIDGVGPHRLVVKRWR
ncbi:MAG: GNAT family N-acetyltransferase [Cellvibrionaceae bacterium]